jgi:hypothetical protein
MKLIFMDVKTGFYHVNNGTEHKSDLKITMCSSICCNYKRPAAHKPNAARSLLLYSFSLMPPTFYLRIYTAESPGYIHGARYPCMLVYSLGHSLIKNNTLYGGIKVELSHSLSRTRWHLPPLG